MLSDKRKTRRRPLRYPAWIDPGGDSRLCECVISDVSESGARLTVRVADDLPETFVLRLSSDGSSNRQCRIVWRSDSQIGIEFQKVTVEAPRPGRRGAARQGRS